MFGDRAAADEELRRDFAIGAAREELMEHTQLARGQAEFAPSAPAGTTSRANSSLTIDRLEGASARPSA